MDTLPGEEARGRGGGSSGAGTVCGAVRDEGGEFGGDPVSAPRPAEVEPDREQVAERSGRGRLACQVRPSTFFFSFFQTPLWGYHGCRNSGPPPTPSPPWWEPSAIEGSLFLSLYVVGQNIALHAVSAYRASI